jgi:hypothetical protein
MGNLNDRVGWGVVALAMVALFFVVNGQDRLRFPNMMPEAELRRLAETNLPIVDAVIYRTESVVMSETEWAMKSGAYYPSISNDKPIYIYRAYGEFRQVRIYGGDGFPEYYFQAVEVVLDAEHGIGMQIGAIPKQVIPSDLHEIPDVSNYQLPIIPTVPPYATAEVMPTMVRLEATEEID